MEGEHKMKLCKDCKHSLKHCGEYHCRLFTRKAGFTNFVTGKLFPAWECYQYCSIIREHVLIFGPCPQFKAKKSLSTRLRKPPESGILRYIYRKLWGWSLSLYEWLENRRPGGGF